MIRPRGLNPEKRYTIVDPYLDVVVHTAAGAELAAGGIPITLARDSSVIRTYGTSES